MLGMRTMQRAIMFLFQEINLDKKWSDNELFVEGLSEILIYLSNTLKNAVIRDNELYTWQLTGNDDMRQMIKLLEAHPEDTITLIATIGVLRYPDHASQPVSFKDIRKAMCNLHFASVPFNFTYWSTPNRMQFLQEVCSFDPYQLLKTVTSNEFYVRKRKRETCIQAIYFDNDSDLEQRDLDSRLRSKIAKVSQKRFRERNIK